MPAWVYWLFLYFLLTIPVFLGLALVARITRSAPAKRASEVVLITGIAALLPVVLQRAFEKPALWLVVALLSGILAVSVVMHVRSYSRSS